MPRSTYGSPEHRRSQLRRPWAYYVTQYGRTAFNLGSKAVQAAKTAVGYKAAELGYGLGKQFVNSFSQNKQMAPARKRALSDPFSTPTKSRKTNSSKNLARAAAALKKIMAPTTPGIMVRRGGRILKKRPSQYGATSSKSAGFVKKPAGKQSVLDRFAKQGIITCREIGQVVGGSGGLKYQTVVLHQTTCGKDQLIIDVSMAFAKAIANRAFGIDVENIDAVILPVGSRRIKFTFRIQTSPGTFANVDIDTPIIS